MSDGIHTMDFESYQKAEGISNTMLGWLEAPSTPAHFRARWITGEIVEEETEALRMGRLTHRCILEPDTMDGAFHVKPKGMKFTNKEGIAWRDEHQDKPIITTDEATGIEKMRDSVWRHPVAKKLIRASKKEQNLFAKDSHGTLRKCRCDLLPSGGNVLADLKTCGSAHPDEFAKNVGEHGYHRQAAFYLAITKLLGLDFTDWLFIAVEKTPPYAVNVMQLDAMALDAGRVLINRDLQLYRNCLESNEWPAFGDGYGSVSLPPWKMRELENLTDL